MHPNLAPLHAALGPPLVHSKTSAVWCADAVESLRQIPSESVPLVLTSPPYNIGKPYDTPRTVAEYVAWCASWLVEVQRILTPTGAAWINLGFLAVPPRGTAVPIPYLLWPHLHGLHLIQEVVWQQPNGVACRRRLSPRNEKLLWLVKDENRNTFNLDAIRDPNLTYPNQTRRHPLGKNPGDVWLIPRVTAGRRSAERTNHPAQMPLRLAERIILAASHPGELVLDPFAGSGTTLVVAARCGRIGAGIELRADYCELARGRLD